MDGGNHRNAHGFEQTEGALDVGQRIEHGRTAFGAGVVHLDGAAEGVQRHAGGEMFARAGDHQHASRGRGVQVFEHRVQLFPKGRPHGVQGLRAVEHQVGDVIFNREGKATEFVHVHSLEGFCCQHGHCSAGRWA